MNEVIKIFITWLRFEFIVSVSLRAPVSEKSVQCIPGLVWEDQPISVLDLVIGPRNLTGHVILRLIIWLSPYGPPKLLCLLCF